VTPPRDPQTVVVTGANRGLGLALALAYAGRGDTVVAGCRRPDAAEELAAVTPHVHAVDLADESSIDAFVAAVGDRPVDVLVNNAGIDARNLGAADGERDVLAQPAEHFVGQIMVNTWGPLVLTRGLLANLRASTRGRIVNVSSQIGSMEVGARIGRDLGYATSKAALNMVTVKLAARLRDDGIVVIALHPGHLRTDMGGPSAAMDAADAGESIVGLVDALTLDDTGTFRRWDGTTHPW
jgi:NAD(P)-dependent dehydrogenase (short-subunit alcohol dehydrogenase family)